MEEFDNRKGHLEILSNDLKNLVGTTNARYFHIKTIENLIFHFEEIKSENDKNWIYETLVEYFDKCTEYVASMNSQISKDLFNNYIHKITDYYYSNLGFALLTNRAVIYIFYIIMLVLGYIFFNVFVVIGLAIFFILLIIRIFNKYRARRVYGLWW